MKAQVGCLTIEEHAEKWRDCCACPLHKERTNVVLYRGQAPCQVLFIGEAPGRVEDDQGLPFVGPAGKVLDAILEHVTNFIPFSYGITNVVACRPTADGADRRPSTKEIHACRGRLEEIIEIAEPKLLVLLGATAAEHVPEMELPTLRLVHPAFILRQGGVLSREYQNAVVLLITFLHANKDVL